MKELKPRIYRQSQTGAVSLFIVVFAALLMTVVTISFISLMITNQQQSTANDLSTSALDSAHAGVEDAKRALLQYQAICDTGSATACNQATSQIGDESSATKCNQAVLSVVPSSDVTASGDVTVKQGSNGTTYDQAYTCVKIGLNTNDYVGTLTNDQSALIPLKGTSAFTTIQLQWYTSDDLQSANSALVDLSNSIAQPAPLFAQSTWKPNRPSVMRAQLIQYGSNGFILSDFDANAGAQSNASTLFLYPSGVSGQANQSNDPAKAFFTARNTPTNTPIAVTCSGNLTSGGYACTAQLTLPQPIRGGDDTAYLNLASIYNATHYRVSLLNNGTPVQFKGVEPEVDSTGRANDLYRRVVSRISLTDVNFPYPTAAVSITSNFCKDFVVTDNVADYFSNCTNNSVITGGGGGVVTPPTSPGGGIPTPPVTPPASNGQFTHPGIGVGLAQLNYVKAHITQAPYVAAYSKLISDANKSAPQVDATINHNDNTAQDLQTAGILAYANALAYYYSGNSTYADKAISILNAWATKLKSFDGPSGAQLDAIWASEVLPRSAELIRYTYSPAAGHAALNVTAITDLFNNVLLPQLNRNSSGSTSSNGNWEMGMADGTMNIGVFTNNINIYNTGISMWQERVPAYIYLSTDNGGNGYPIAPPGPYYNTPTKALCFYLSPQKSDHAACPPLPNYTIHNGQAQETCRDIGHVILAFESMSFAAETARLQSGQANSNLWIQQETRIVTGYEFAAKYLIQQGFIENGNGPVQDNVCGGSLKGGGGGFKYGWVIAYNEYHNRLGIAMPYTAQVIQKLGAQGATIQMDYEALTFTGTPQ